MKVSKLHWCCPVCKSKVLFGHALFDLFDCDDHESYFDPESGVPFYELKCSNEECSARWTFGISGMRS